MKRLIIILVISAVQFISLDASADKLSAKAVFVMNASNGRQLFTKNPNLKVAPASTVKLITAMVVIDRVSPDEEVVISERAEGVSPLKTGFKVGERLAVRDLLYAALIRSANDASSALAGAAAGSEAGFVRLMNLKARKIGARNTRFINPTGLPGKGQFTTASDMAKIMRHALKYPLIREILGTKKADIITEDGRTIHLENINKLLWVDDQMLGGKTGFTRKARHCFVFAAERGEETLIVAVMGAKSRASLWRESADLIKRGFELMQRHAGLGYGHKG